VKTAITGRRPAFTPDWRPPPAGDAGTAAVQLFAEQVEPVLARLNRLPEKIFVETLRTAGIEPVPPRPAAAMLEFTVGAGAEQSALVPRGFQCGASPAGGQGELVVFETERELFAAPAEIAELQLQEGQIFHPLPGGAAGAFQPFGREAKLGTALWIGLAGDVAPGPTLTFGIAVTAPPGEPPPVPAGGVAPLPVAPPPFLQWEVLGARGLEPAELVLDETGALARGGIIELGVPAAWPAQRPPELAGTAPLRWLRVRIVSGRFVRPPSVDLWRLNCVAATAARTVRNEALEPVPDSGGRRFRVSQIPVLPGTLDLVVDEGNVGDPGAQAVSLVSWSAVPDLVAWGPDDRVFVLNPGSGEITFGDGRHGAPVPPGFRNVIARAYRVGGGAAGAVGPDAVSTLLQSVPFVLGVTNPLAASGGSDQEARPDTLVRGPQEIRARFRAVTLADYELLAMGASGAAVARVHAVSGLHPALPGRPIPGVVGVLVIPPDRGQRPLAPDEGSLRAVAEYLSDSAAPAGVTVVAGAVRYHTVRIEAQVIVAPAIDEGEAVEQLLQELNTYLHPLTGGDDGRGWPFGGAIRYAALARRLLEVTVHGRRAIRAVPRLALVLDGLRVGDCEDQALPPHDLPFPGRHEIIPVDDGGEA
jgi:predicted phage baseplate assembly protein